MLVILEGVDKSGKSLLVDMLHNEFPESILIRKQYDSDIYPIDGPGAPIHDWLTIFDRLVLANPDKLFIADRSFITQILYQQVYGHGEHAATEFELTAYQKQETVLAKIPHLVVLCESCQYELDSMVTSLKQVERLREVYRNYFDHLSKTCNTMFIRTDASPVSTIVQTLLQKIAQISVIAKRAKQNV